MARQLDAALELLDRQLLDNHGQPAGKVDDLELTDPGDRLEQPYVTAILTGPGALGGRLHSRFGRWLARVADRPSRVPFYQVEAIGADIRLRVAAGELRAGAGEARVRRLIGRIPGAGDAAQ
jgi:sporulation protein YlmC with PRC-barrel domain